MGSRRGFAVAGRIGVSMLAALLASCERPAVESEFDQTSIARQRAVLKGWPGDWRQNTDEARGIAAPPAETSVPPNAIRIPLPKRELLAYGDLPVREAIVSRRSRRSFSAEPMTIEELACLLWLTQGVTSYREETGEVFRAAPSAGARFPIDTYLSAHRVEGLEPGLYRYRSHNHELVLVRACAGIATEMAAACYGQDAVANAAAVFVWVAVPYRSEWKYSHLSHRMIAMEAGHICQNLYLATEALGAAACAMLSYHQPSLDALLGVDGIEQFAIYTACVGKRVVNAKE